MGRVAFLFHDPEGDLPNYSLVVNPNAGGSPDRRKNIATKATTAGVTILQEAEDEVPTLRWSGVLLTEAQYELFEAWWGLRHPVEVTDDLNRTFTVYFTSLSREREMARSHPWKHSWTIEALEIV